MYRACSALQRGGINPAVSTTHPRAAHGRGSVGLLGFHPTAATELTGERHHRMTALLCSAFWSSFLFLRESCHEPTLIFILSCFNSENALGYWCIDAWVCFLFKSAWVNWLQNYVVLLNKLQLTQGNNFFRACYILYCERVVLDLDSSTFTTSRNVFIEL